MRPAAIRMAGASSTSVHDVLTGARQSAEWLGVCDSALYLLTHTSTVLAVVTHDAVRLPCAVVLPRTAAELPLTRLARASGFGAASVGAGTLDWVGPAGHVTVECVRQWRPPRLPVGSPDPAASAYVRGALAGVDLGLEPARLAALTPASDFAGGDFEDRQAGATAGLLGRGPGLTPSGDDVLAGFLIGARVFGRQSPGVRRVVAESAAVATTALSAQLLQNAARGECIEQLAALARALVAGSVPPTVLRRLLSVGHTSGAALAHGLLAAAAAPVSSPASTSASSSPSSAEWRAEARHSTPNPPLNGVGAA